VTIRDDRQARHRAARPQLASIARVPAPVPALRPGRRPRVSIIIPCFNYGHYLPQSVGSALAQHDVEPEVIIVDDASTDDSAQIAARYARSDGRVSVVAHSANTGHVQAFNDGLREATGEFIVRLDADDLLTPGSAGRAVALFDAFPEVGLVYGHPLHFTTAEPPAARTVDRGWHVWSGADWVARRCARGVNCITTPEAVIRASVMRSVGGLNTALHFAQDMEMWLRTASVSDVGRIDGADQALHRDHPASMSATSGAGQLLDLQERATVFDVLFAGPGGQLGRAEELHQMARQALAAEALVTAYRAYDRGRTGTVDVDSFVGFALSAYPGARSLPQWRALQRRVRVGARLAPVHPVFTASVILRRVRWMAEYRQWQRTGV
jgi:cellulose synthase/poly-beta-1,6-N-acetylglucosamine synthase-like glycosyltransferase